MRYPRVVPRDAACSKLLQQRTLTRLYNAPSTWRELYLQRVGSSGRRSAARLDTRSAAGETWTPSVARLTRTASQMTGGLPSPPRHRDLRVDLLRGCVLAMVFVDHLEEVLGVRLLSRYTLQAVGPSDAAEQFILLSGLMAGRTYASRIERRGLVSAQRHALWRTGQLYLAYLLAASLTLGLVYASGQRPECFAGVLPETADDWPGRLEAVATLGRAPYMFHILTVYLLLLPLTPGLVWLGRRWLAAPLLLALALYGSLHGLEFTAGREHALAVTRWYFNPCGWQLAYVIGMTAGLCWERRERSRRGEGTGTDYETRPRVESSTGRGVSWRACAVMVCGVVLASGWSLRPAAVASWGLTASQPGWVRDLLVPLLHKWSLAPLRLVHGLAVAALPWLLLPSSLAARLPAVLRPLAWTGRYSLQTYTLGAVWSGGALYASRWFGTAPESVLQLALDGWLLVTAGAWLRLTWRRETTAAIPERHPVESNSSAA